jgi:3-phosphoglycerate kinase
MLNEKEQDNIEKITKLLEVMMKQFVAIIEANNNLLVENLRLMKENDELRKRERPYFI